MENLEEAKILIAESKNIYLIPSEEPDAIASAIALFYTLKDLGKKVNVILEQLPKNLLFLSPSLDFLSYPKNFVISISENVAKISQIHYEKNNGFLKIHLSSENGNIKKDDIAFYYAETKPDVVITIGIKNYQKELEGRLNSLGFLLDSPVINIDKSTNSVQENKKFGKINIITEKSLAEVMFDIDKTFSKEPAECLLTALVIHTNNFTKNQTAETFQLASILMKAGADLKKIIENLKNA